MTQMIKKIRKYITEGPLIKQMVSQFILAFVIYMPVTLLVSFLFSSDHSLTYYLVQGTICSAGLVLFFKWKAIKSAYPGSRRRP